jgi:hypothetical protein
MAMLTSLALMAALICPQPQNAAFTGLWESTATSRGGIGHTIEFRSDGSFVQAITVIVNMRYRLKGDRLFLDSPAAPGDQNSRDPAIITIKGQKLLEKGPDGSVIEKDRLNAAIQGEPALVGAWRYRHYTGAIAFERYMPDGQLLFRLPMSSSTGCFVERGRDLTLAEPNQPEKQFRYDISGAGLVLTDSAGHSSSYHKDPNGPWYDREHLDYKRPK